MTSMPASAPGSEEAVQGYESLREEALAGRRGSGGLGLALFLRDGMASWMRAWIQATASHVRPMEKRERAEPGPPADVRTDLVAILAQMVLSPRVEG